MKAFESKKKAKKHRYTSLAGIWEVTQITLRGEIQAKLLRLLMPSKHSWFLLPKIHFSTCKKVNSHHLQGNVSDYFNPQIIHFYIITYMIAPMSPYEPWANPTHFEAKIQSSCLGFIAHRLILDIVNVGQYC